MARLLRCNGTLHEGPARGLARHGERNVLFLQVLNNRAVLRHKLLPLHYWGSSRVIDLGVMVFSLCSLGWPLLRRFLAGVWHVELIEVDGGLD